MLKFALSFSIFLAVGHQAFAKVCPTTPIYNHEFVPDCTSGNEKILWPYYKDVSQYFRCQSLGNSVLVSCPGNMVFDYFKQACTSCKKYIAAPECNALILPSGKKPKCLNTPYQPTNTTVKVAPECKNFKFDKTNKYVKKSTTSPILTSTIKPTFIPKSSIDCPALKKYSHTFLPPCTSKDMKILWPNYDNPSEYYLCLGEHKPQIRSCVYKTYFNFFLQKCTKCEEYIPAPNCSNLTAYLETKPICEPINSTVATPTAATDKPICKKVPLYSKYFKTYYEPACRGNEIFILWPDYTKPTQYLQCIGTGIFKKVECIVPNTYFNYYAQLCTTCGNFILPPECEKLKTEGKPTCKKTVNAHRNYNYI